MAPGHSKILKGGGAEETTAGGGGDAGEFGAGLRGLQVTYQECVGFEISGESLDGGQRRLACGGQQPGEGAEDLGTVVSGSRPGGIIPEGVEELLYSGCPGGPTLWGGDLGPHSEYGEGPGQF